MAKNLKLNIKNTQLAQALNLGKLKNKLASNKPVKPKKQDIEEEVVPPTDSSSLPVEDEPRRVKARAKGAGPVRQELENVAPVEQISATPFSKEAAELLEAEEEHQRRIAKGKSFLQGDDESTIVSEVSTEEATPEEHAEEPLPSSSNLPTESSPKTESSPQGGMTHPEVNRALPEHRTAKQAPKKSAPQEAPYRKEAPKHAPKYAAPFISDQFRGRKDQDTYLASTPRVKLGPTGRHIKDLVKPKPEPIKKEAFPFKGPKNLETTPSYDSGKQKSFNEQPVPPKEEQGGTRHIKRKEDSSVASESDVRRGGKAKEFLDIKPLKKQGVKGFDSRDRQGLGLSDEDGWRRRKAKQVRHEVEDTTIRPTSLKIRVPISIKDLAVEMKLKAAQLVSKLFLQGLVVTLNDLLEDETTLQLLGHEFGCDIQIDKTEEQRIRITNQTIQEEIQSIDPSLCITRAPIVTFMGHVDHGKTSLIDAIRKSNRVSAEAGAITQHIGAFRCSTAVGDLTILDTPGHEAFSAMRSRGAAATDIVVLVIAGDEGIKQQTLEALEQARAANVTIVVALNKCDKPGFNAENVYQQLAAQNLLPESWGGSTITVNCSAVSGVGIPELLEMLALQAEVLELKADPNTRARGTVLESEMHKGLGVVATVLVQNGTLRLGDSVVFDQLWGRVKTMRDEHGKNLTEAGPSTPVEITGISGLPEAGHEFIVVKSEKEARNIAETRAEGIKQSSLSQKKKLTIENLMQQAATSQKKSANFILRADVQGSLEALKASLLNIQSSKIDVNIISSGVGEISESDVELATVSDAVIIGFHTQIESHAETLIKQSGIKVHMHNVIYHAIDDVKKLLLSLLDKIPEERDLGAAEITTTFKASQLGTIAGCLVTEGTIVRNQRVRLIRNNEVIWKGHIASLKRVKEDVKEIKKGFECGILLEGQNDVQPGDIIQCYEIYYLTQEL
ncbi:MAG: translation initiation factor IF-2 [Chlamydiales bacterium]|nr:translation initiation factor IF-2 [Chlamydiales bacterium]